MSKRKRFKDKSKAAEVCGVGSGNKKINKSWKKRHSQRLRDAASESDNAQTWLEQRDWWMQVCNGGHHWIIYIGENTVEWWPSSAKLVINKNFKNGIHTHDWNQVQAVIKKLFGGEDGAPSC